MTEIPGITRPKTETEHALERANSARQAVLILADAYGAEDRFTTHTGRLNTLCGWRVWSYITQRTGCKHWREANDVATY